MKLFGKGWDEALSMLSKVDPQYASSLKPCVDSAVGYS